MSPSSRGTTCFVCDRKLGMSELMKYSPFPIPTRSGLPFLANSIRESFCFVARSA